MYVRKFESNTLEEAFNDIKRELGPDAIILKTMTNRGFKGAFRKKKVEVTAAISEKSYLKKAKVDAALPEEDRDKFYSDRASHISNMIDKYDAPPQEQKKGPSASQGYGKIGLNQSVKKIGSKLISGLDEFLNHGPQEAVNIEPSPSLPPVGTGFEPVEGESSDKIEILEKRILELERRIEGMSSGDTSHLSELRTMLKSLDVGEKHIQEIMRKIINVFSKEELDDAETIYEFTLREMLSRIKTEMPLFSRCDTGNESAVTVLISRNQCGQSSTVRKLAALKEGSVVLQNFESRNMDLTAKIYNIDSINVSSLSELVSATRKSLEEDKNIFIDYKDTGEEVEDIKKIIGGLKKAFDNVEVLSCISSIHSEVYNRNILSKYTRFVDGIVATNIDMCLNYGQLFNIACDFSGTPFKFFGTGETIPDDIESATGERIIAGLFQLNY